jgi:hypothetical protein
MLKHLGFPQENPTEIYIDNRSVIALAKNPGIMKEVNTLIHVITLSESM